MVPSGEIEAADKGKRRTDRLFLLHLLHFPAYMYTGNNIIMSYLDTDNIYIYIYIGMIIIIMVINLYYNIEVVHNRVSFLIIIRSLDNPVLDRTWIWTNLNKINVIYISLHNYLLR